MPENKTKPTSVAVEEFIAAIEDPGRRADAVTLDALFRRVTGWTPAMWGPSMIGYGSYDYTYASGHSGSSLATGFSPRKAELSIYILPGYQDYGLILARLGKHRTENPAFTSNACPISIRPSLKSLSGPGCGIWQADGRFNRARPDLDRAPAVPDQLDPPEESQRVGDGVEDLGRIRLMMKAPTKVKAMAKGASMAEDKGFPFRTDPKRNRGRVSKRWSPRRIPRLSPSALWGRG